MDNQQPNGGTGSADRQGTPTGSGRRRRAWEEMGQLGGDIILAGRYKLGPLLGEGYMGTVWLAEDLRFDGWQVVLKMVPQALEGRKILYRPVEQAAREAMRLSHLNIVTVRGFEDSEGTPYAVMDYIEGRRLDTILADKGRLTAEETMMALGPVAAALDYAHGAGVLHRDVRPGNVLVRKDGTPFVRDFGISRAIQEAMVPRVPGKPETGPLEYMSPEQMHGAPPTAAQDVYSFAAMAYECLTGHPPFGPDDLESQIVNQQPAPIPENLAGELLRAGIMAGLSKEPEERPKSCAAVLMGVLGKERAEEAGERMEAAAVAAVVPPVPTEGVRDDGTGGGTGEAAVDDMENKVEAEAVVPRPKKRKGSGLGWVAVLVLAVGAGVWWWKDGVTKRAAMEQKAQEEAVRKAEQERLACQKVAEEEAAKRKTAEEQRQQELARKASEDKLEEERLSRMAAREAVARETANKAARKRAEWEAREALRKAPEAEHLAREEAARKAAEEVREKAESETKQREEALAKQEQQPQEPVVVLQENEPSDFQSIDGSTVGETKIIVLPGGVTMEMVWCPPGSFMMGSPSREERRFGDERQHRVTLTAGFWMAKTELTQKQWMSVMGKNPSQFQGDNLPVECVSWNDCQAFCQKVGAGLRLPTEAEWEYACRAGSTGAYGGMGRLGEMGWYGDNSGRQPHPVGEKRANAWGLYDLHGNVWEWCSDWYELYPAGEAMNPKGAISGAYRVMRGGSCFIDAKSCRSARRDRYTPEDRNAGIGFRPCASSEMAR